MNDDLRGYALHAKEFLLFNRSGVLCTQSRTNVGFPFGSIVNYDIVPDGRLYIYISKISEHFKNLNADPRSSLIVADPYGVADPQAHARATALCEFQQVPAESRKAVAERYFDRFPQAEEYEKTHDFAFFSGNPHRVRWIGGFGEIGWISGEHFRSAAANPLAYRGIEVCEHMNIDHRDALCDFVRAWSAFNPDDFRVQMVHLHEGGFTISLDDGGRMERIELKFPALLNNIDDVRAAMLSMLKEARAKIAH